MVLPTASTFRTRETTRKWPQSSFLLAILLWFIVGGYLLSLVGLVGVAFPSPSIEVKDGRTTSNSDWAYVFLLADCDPTIFQPSYRGLLYNILAATYVLKVRFDTTADIVILIQMAYSSPTDRLTQVEEDVFQKMKIQFHYLPKPSKPTLTFYELVMTKFFVLQMIEYKKILFLDSDVLPLCSLDYLFRLSQDGILGDMIVHAMYEDPINAGLFLVTPHPHLHDTLFDQWTKFQDMMKNIIPTTKENRLPSVEYILWDGTIGSAWDFYCADSDQGFILYSILFGMDDTTSGSIITGTQIQHYDSATMAAVSASSSTTTTTTSTVASKIPRREQRQPTRILSTDDILGGHSCLSSSSSSTPLWAKNVSPRTSHLGFYKDFFHMVGYSKAWEDPSPSWKIGMEMADLTSSSDYWYYCLHQVAQKFDPYHTVIPPNLNRLHEVVSNPKIRGDLFVALPPPTVKSKHTKHAQFTD